MAILEVMDLSAKVEGKRDKKICGYTTIALFEA
jgi:hypothetical protein